MWNPFKKLLSKDNTDAEAEAGCCAEADFAEEEEAVTAEAEVSRQSYPHLPDFNREDTKRIRTVTRGILIDKVKRTSSLKEHAKAVSREARATTHTFTGQKVDLSDLNLSAD